MNLFARLFVVKTHLLYIYLIMEAIDCVQWLEGVFFELDVSLNSFGEVSDHMVVPDSPTRFTTSWLWDIIRRRKKGFR